MSTFSTPTPITALLEVAGARVRITAADRADTSVLVEPVDAANRSHVKVADRTKVEFADGTLSVKTVVAGSRDGSVTITITVPTGSRLIAYIAYSEVTVEGSLGDTEVHAASGRVALGPVAALLGNVATGSLEVVRVAGSSKIDGGAFDLRVGEAGGTLVLRNSGGTTRIGHAAGDIDLGTASSDVDIDRADGDVTVATSSGSIRVGRMRAGRARLTTGSGDVEVGVVDGAAASVDIASERGAAHDFVSSGLRTVDPGAPKVMVHARTRHGDVVVQRVAADAHEASASSTS